MKYYHHYHDQAELKVRSSLTHFCDPSLLLIAPGWSTRLYPVSVPSLCQLAITSTFTCRTSLKNLAYEFVLASPEEICISCSCYFNGL